MTDIGEIWGPGLTSSEEGTVRVAAVNSGDPPRTPDNVKVKGKTDSEFVFLTISFVFLSIY